MTDKERYRELCKIEKTIPIFSKDWWMDAVCGESNWDVILVDKGGKIVGALPYYARESKGKKSIVQPVLTQKNGVWIAYPSNQKYAKKLAYEKDIMNSIIDKLSELKLEQYNQNFHYGVTNWLPFYWKGFTQTTRYTYVIENLYDIDNIFNNIDSKTRNQIRKSEKIVNIKEDMNIEDFYKLNTMTFNRQSIKIPYSLEVVKKIYEACSANGCVKILFAEDDEGNVHSAVFVVWDENSAYYLMGANDPNFRYSESNTLLIWEAIKYCSKVTKKFDFEGSMIEDIERFFRSFGAEQKAYFNISKYMAKKSLIKIIIKDIYSNSDALNKLYNKLRGK
ncbi:hypothetical protein CSC2_42380 [Clostridium zeae]|uniref:BioF2-like acetyltransferase domain-containing protein n=1 Tax=Clostridium zeae TaxID=2759022 RepID=A0ABQ1EFW1_9CLOT|nr:GNAT family N-acetyltransferase [Clostridium zeae]GFZ33712.1 hypothetical protein CSC2_42380 [Clostridium zeae]